MEPKPPGNFFRRHWLALALGSVFFVLSMLNVMVQRLWGGAWVCVVFVRGNIVLNVDVAPLSGGNLVNYGLWIGWPSPGGFPEASVGPNEFNISIPCWLAMALVVAWVAVRERRWRMRNIGTSN